LESASPHFAFDEDGGDPFASLILASSAGRLAAGGNPDGSSSSDGQSGTVATSEAQSFDYDDPRYLVVVANDERIVLEAKDLTTPNQDGWTPLHACCHSHLTISAGLAIIDAMKAAAAARNKNSSGGGGGLGGLFEQKTKSGPGTGNAGWTALHMAAAYGVEPLVVALIAAKADCNCTHSLSWSPLNEACHRGFLSVAKELVLVGGADVDHMPDAEACRKAPFARPPPQVKKRRRRTATTMRWALPFSAKIPYTGTEHLSPYFLLLSL
jgi:hypothetical protein